MTPFKIIILSAFVLPLFNYSLAQTNRLTETFPLSSPEQQGISSNVLNRMMLFIKDSNQNIHHLIIIRNGYAVLDADVYPYSSQYLHDIASVTKSITSLLTGIAIDKGFIKDENEKVLKFFPEITNHNKFLDSLKIKDLVTMTSGFACGVSDGEKALSEMRKSKDWVKFIFDLPMTSKPGETFSYCSCNFYLLGEIIYRATGLTPHEFAKKYLFSPLQISNSKWLANYKSINHGWGDLFLYPADMAKIGKMVLDKGKWQNKQVVSEQWITKCLQTFIKLSEDKGYTYGWWTNDKVGYCEAAGRGRQTISVIPSKNMVVVMLGGEFDAGTIGKYIFKSIQSDAGLPENNDLAVLNKTTKEIALPLAAEHITINDTLIKKLNEATIAFEKNISAIDSMQFNFSSNTAGTVVLYRNDSKEKYPFAIDNKRYAISMDSTLQLPVALQAECKNANEFVLHYNQLCRINNFYFHFFIATNSITTTMEETSNFIKTNVASTIHFN